jgi:ribosomal protein S18 acetylase RimI-like enzyme
MDIRIRKSNKRDIESVKKIAVKAFQFNSDLRKKILGKEMFKIFYPDWQNKKRRTIEYLFNSEDCKVFVAESKGKIVGFASFKLDKAKPFVSEILTNAVSPRYQGQGIAKMLYKKLLDELKSMRIKYVYVGTNNDFAKKAYEKVGFVKKLESTQYFMKL